MIKLLRERIEPLEISLEEAAGGVTAESSIGTWTDLTRVQSFSYI
jgi:ribulose 1,5-bisphosphate carboxylase large subunit-like protein